MGPRATLESDRRRIVALGGGGFGDPPGDPALDRYLLGVSGVARPRVCLLPTASGDPEEQIARFYRAYTDLPCEPSHLSLFRLGTKPVDVRTVLLGHDIVYAGGGSLLNLLAIWRAHGVDAILREAWERGIVLCGASAGSMCWFRTGVTKSHGPPTAVPGLGLLPGSNSVHYHEEPERRPCFMEAVRAETAPPGFGVDDGVALLFAGTELVEAVSERPAAGAWWVEGAGDSAIETPLPVRRLDSPATAGAPLSIAEYRAARRRERRSRGAAGATKRPAAP
jgi:dipeptidase E